MRKILMAAAAVAVVAIAAAPPAALAAPAAAISAQVADRLVLPAPKAGRSRPIIVVVASNDGAETTDFTIPYGVLKESGVADVRSLSTAQGPVQLRMALKVRADATIAQFDSVEPAGADIVIVPAQMSPKDPALIAWVQAQAAKGATIVSVCEGARVIANAGLLEGKRATSHWSALDRLKKDFPATDWVSDHSYLQDGSVISTAGVSASIPVSLALIEAIGGRATAEKTAAVFGVSDWSATHRTADFELRKGDVSGAVRSLLAFWKHEQVELPLSADMDEVALALRADAWSRTFRSKVVATSNDAAEVQTRHGLTVLADAKPRSGHYVVASLPGPAVPQLDLTLTEIDRRYGSAAVRLAKLGMEYDGASLQP